MVSKKARLVERARQTVRTPTQGWLGASPDRPRTNADLRDATPPAESRQPEPAERKRPVAERDDWEGLIPDKPLELTDGRATNTPSNELEPEANDELLEQWLEGVETGQPSRVQPANVRSEQPTPWERERAVEPHDEWEWETVTSEDPGPAEAEHPVEQRDDFEGAL